MGSFWQGKRVFVTGCTGLLGPWLTESLVQKGALVVGLVRDRVPMSNFYLLGLDSRVIVVRGEVTDVPLLERTLNEYEIDAVFHIAAQAIVPTANRSPISTFESNIRGTWSLLEATRNSPWVKRIIVASSDKAYGEHEELPYREEMALCPTNFYDVTKASGDLLARAYHKNFNLPVCITRCGNLYGGGDLNFNRIIPGTIEAVLQGTQPVIRSDGQYVRDYFYVADAVDAYLSLAEHIDLSSEVAGLALNFSNEEPITVLALVDKILKRMGREDLKPEILGTTSGEIRRQYLSSQKSRRLLGWIPRYNLDEGLDETITWYSRFFAERNRRSD